MTVPHALTTPSQFRESCQRTRNHDLDLRDQRLNAAIGLGETGELQNIVKKWAFHGHSPDRIGVLDEAGDVLYYLDWLLDTYDWTLADAFTLNIDKLRQRYPDGFSSERSINRKDGK